MKSQDDIQKYLYKQFGLNAGYVVDTYQSYIKDNSSVSKYWQDYFGNIFNVEKKSSNEKNVEEKTSC